MGERELEERLHTVLAAVPSDAVLRLRVSGELVEEAAHMLSAKYLRSIAPTTMNVDIRIVDDPSGFRRRKRSSTAGRTPELPFPPTPPA